MSFPKYEVYKESGVEWLGEVPEQWETSKLKFLCKIQTGDKDTVDSIDDGQYPFFVRSQTIERINSFSHNCEAVLTAGDGAGVGKVFHYIQGAFDFHQRVYMLNNFQKVLGQFVFHYLKENFYKVALAGEAKSTVDSLRMPTFLNFIFTVPTLHEQTQIIKFIDRETARIDALIAEQQRLIELLKEKRQAVISHAVTKGIDRTVPMKDSGVEWLGEVPEHWGVLQIRRLFCIKKIIAGKLGYDVLSITQKGIKKKDIDSGDGQLASDYSKYQLVEPGDFAMNQMDLLTGYVDISKFYGVTSPDYRVFKLENPAQNPEFFLRIFQNAYHQKLFFPLGQGAAHLGRWRLPTEAFNCFWLTVPPLEEQSLISIFIRTELSKFDALLDEATKNVSLLMERRSALISAAVTGKIDVRNWQPSPEPTHGR
jgi:type I restriction enzyme, S subunit